MTKTLLALGAAAVAFTAMPAEARHYTNITQCARYRHGHCVEWRRLTRAEARREGYNVGYNFGPRYAYTDLGALPQPIVTRYHLRDNFRYVSRDCHIYVLNPNTYRVVRVLDVG